MSFTFHRQGLAHRSRQRLEDEYSSEVIITAPTVPYKGGPCCGMPLTAVIDRHGTEKFVSNPTEFPDMDNIKNSGVTIQEPMGESGLEFQEQG